MTSYWFKPKRYGYGATPVTWQGWAVTIAAIAAIVAASLSLATADQGPLSWLAAFAIDLVVIVSLLIVSRRKTEGEWRWRWGGE